MYYIDMHIHTTASDGMLTPEEVVDWAVKKKIQAIAITDHDTISGVAKAIQYSKIYRNFVVIPGIEISCSYNDEDVHILGYFIDYKSPELKYMVDKFKIHRENRGEKIVKKLKEIGLHIEYKEVKKITPNNVVGRPHIARVLIAKGYVDNMNEAFDKYLKKGTIGYVKKYKFSIKEAIDLIHNVNGIAILAHPGLLKKEETFKNIIKMNIDGLEIYHSKHSERQKNEYEKIAVENNLLITGGSDCHGRLIDKSPILGDYGITYNEFKKIEHSIIKGRFNIGRI